MSVLIVVPTVDGRDEHLARCIRDYHATLKGVEHQIEIYRNYSTCGEVWNLGAKKAREKKWRYVHMTADDLSPHSDWYNTAVETVGRGLLPAALVYNPDGSLPTWGNQYTTEWAPMAGGSVPFLFSRNWFDIPNIHYYSDNAYDAAQKVRRGMIFVARKNYAFTHYTAQAGRKSVTEIERAIYEKWVETL